MAGVWVELVSGVVCPPGPCHTVLISCLRLVPCPSPVALTGDHLGSLSAHLALGQGNLLDVVYLPMLHGTLSVISGFFHLIACHPSSKEHREVIQGRNLEAGASFHGNVPFKEFVWITF